MSTKTAAEIEYYPRKSLRGKIVLVRNGNRRRTMMDKLTNSYAQGIYTGAAGVGMIAGMAMMARRKDAMKQIDRLRQQAQTANFSYGDPQNRRDLATRVRRRMFGARRDRLRRL